MTLRVVRGLPSLRGRAIYREICRAIAGGAERFGFRLVHFSVQSNHLHLIGEAEDRDALRRGMQGLSIRVAKAINHALRRRGTVFADRYHARAMRKPREVRSGLAYVLQNARKHGAAASRRWIDPFSSALLFDGWNTGRVETNPGVVRFLLGPDGFAITARAESWLLTTGWRRYGPVFTDEVPVAWAAASR